MTIRDLFQSHQGRRTSKWNHYLDVYDRYLGEVRQRLNGRPVRLLEIGIRNGGSLQIWRSYFGPDAEVFAIDVDPRCMQFEDTHTKIFIGDQADRNFLNSVRNKIPRLDIIIDDGGHIPHQQIASFEVLFPHVEESGIYIIEDLHTSYWPDFHGGYGRNSFIEYGKRLIDLLHGWYWYNRKPADFRPERESNLDLNDVSAFTRNARALHFHDSMLVVERGIVEVPSKMEFGGGQDNVNSNSC